MSINSRKTFGELVADFIIKRQKAIENTFLALFIISIVCALFVGTNYDLTKYLPSSAPTKQGIKIMENEFGYPGSARVMVDNVTIFEAKSYVSQIEKIDGVDSVTWAGSIGQLNVADDYLKMQDLGDYYKDGHALLNITFVKGDSDPKTYEALNQIEKIIGNKGHYTGPSVDNKTLGDTLNAQIPKIMVGVIILIFVILILTTNSWFEPIIFLLTMGVAIILNIGSNIIFGEISFLSVSVSSVLQLAVAMDYSVFLLHALSNEKAKGLGVEKALSNVLKKILLSIISAAMTATIGFLALALMKFSIGKDMGFVLAKGMFWSLLSVIFLMPVLILRWNKLIEKTKHKSFIPNLDKLINKVFSAREVVAILVIILIIPAYFAQSMNNFIYGTTSVGGGKGTKTYENQQAINNVFGESNTLLIIIPNENMVKERELGEELDNLPFVKSVTSLSGTLPTGVTESILPEDLTSKLHTARYARLIVDLNFGSESDYAFKSVDEVKTIVKKYYQENAYFVGTTPATEDIKAIISFDYSTVDKIALLGVALVLLISFRSIILTIAVLIPIKAAVYMNMALPFLYGNTMIFLGYLMVSSIQLGATVDYAILLTNYYLIERKNKKTPTKAAIAAIKSSIVSIMTSGTVLTIVGYGLYFVMSIPAIGDMGRLIGRGALISMFLVICLLPFLLMISDTLYEKERILFRKIASYLKKILEQIKKTNFKKVKRFAVGSTGLLLITILNVSPVLAKAPTPTTDETSYFTLDYYGSVQKMSVVKGVDLNSNTQIVDYGKYSKVTNMSTLNQPEIDSGKLVWDLDEKTAPKRFYYEVTPENSLEIPWKIDVNYKLNGVPAKAEKLAGASGLVAVDVTVTPNNKANIYYRNNFVLMVGMIVDSNKNYSFSAPGSQQMSLGSEQVVFYIALPKQTETFHFEIGTDSFETDGVVMAMTPITLKQMEAIKEIKAHKNNIENAGKAIDSTLNDIFDNMTSMQSGIQTTVNGLNDLNDARQSISNDSSTNINNLNQTKDYLSALQARLNSFNYIIGLSPYSATASAMGVNDGLTESSNLLGNLSNTVGSVGSTISDSGDKLNSGLDQTLNGMSTLMSDMNSTLDKTNDLKTDKNIISGIIKDEWNRFDNDLGILDIDIDATKISFTSPQNPAPRSLQIILRTQEIKVDKKEKEAEIEEEKDKLGFWGRVKLVYTTIYETIKENF